jgi:2-dehydropantoate 2-reductase
VCLSAGGLPVILIGRRPPVAGARDLRAVGLDGGVRCPGRDLVLSDRPQDLGAAGLCLLAVKAPDVAPAVPVLARELPAGAPVLCLQNGLRALPALAGLGRPLAAGVVGFNLVREGPATVRKTTPGEIFLGPLPAPHSDLLGRVVAALRRVGEPAVVRPDIAAAQAGKLLVNLNNGVCAATGLSILQSLRSRDARWCYARALDEALRVLRAARIPATRAGHPVPPRWLPRLLGLPDALFLRLLRIAARVDPAARLSTLQDLEAGRPTEIEFLNGEVVRLAAQAGLRSPVNAFLVEQVHALERAGRPPPFLPPGELRRRIDERLRLAAP